MDIHQLSRCLDMLARHDQRVRQCIEDNAALLEADLRAEGIPEGEIRHEVEWFCSTFLARHEHEMAGHRRFISEPTAPSTLQ